MDINQIAESGPGNGSGEDTQATNALLFGEGFEPVDEEQFTYRHKTIRNFSIGQFEFQNHVLVVTGMRANEMFKKLLASTPPAERNNIVVWHPEVLSQLEKPIDYRPSGVVRGAQSVSTIQDPKVNPATPDKPNPLDLLKMQNRTTT